MGFSAVRGHARALGLLRRSVAEGRIAHAHLFHGPEGVGKELAAKNFAKLLNCRAPREGDACDFCEECLRIEKNDHPDVLWLRPEGKKRIIKIGDPVAPEAGTIRDFQRRVSLKPFQARWKVGIFAEADCMEEPAESALLKTLEEPPSHTVLVLITSRPESLLPTIISRCQAVRFAAMPEHELEALLCEEHRLRPEDAHALSRLVGGRYGSAVSAIREGHLGEVRELGRLLSAGETGYWRAVAGPLGLFENCLRKAEDALEMDLVERGLLSPLGAGGERVRSGAAHDEEREKQASAFIQGEMRRRHEEMLHRLLAWYRDLLVWNLTGDEKLLAGGIPASAVRRAAAGVSAARAGECVRRIETALEALWMNADFHAVMENLLVQLTAANDT